MPEIPFEQTICKRASGSMQKTLFGLTHKYTPGAWHLSLNTLIGQVSCDAPSVSMFDHRQSSSARPGLCSAVPSCKSTLLGFKLHQLNVEGGGCNTCGGKWPSGFSGPRAHGWQFTRIPCTDCTGDCVTIPNREKHGSAERDFKHGSTKDFNNAFHSWRRVMLSLLITDKGAGPR